MSVHIRKKKKEKNFQRYFPLVNDISFLALLLDNIKSHKKVLSSDKKQNIIHHNITIESIGFCLEGFYKHNANRMVRKKNKENT